MKRPAAVRQGAATPRGRRPAVTAADDRPPLLGLPPVVGAGSRVLILGSFPGAASLAAAQYYAHPRNQLWPLLGAIWGTDLRALPYAERLRWLPAHGLGVWDVHASCHRDGSLDSAIRAARPNDVLALLARWPRIEAVLHNGGASAQAGAALQDAGVAVHKLPSTSPANAGWSFERKLQAWRAALALHGLPDAAPSA